MPWTIRYDEALNIVMTEYSGIVLPEELQLAARETVLLAQRHGTRLVLTDCTKIEGGHTVVDLYRLADWVAAQKFVPPFREAVLLTEEALSNENVRFWETTCVNRGLQVKQFADAESAMQWLNI